MASRLRGCRVGWTQVLHQPHPAPSSLAASARRFTTAAPRLNQSFFTRTPPRVPLGRRALWLLPLAGGTALYLIPRSEPTTIPAVLASRTLIPCKQGRPAAVINSPAEPQRSILSRILGLLHDYLWEPLLTARRFAHLFIVFAPVIASAPMLLVGTPERRFEGDRWGAVWWYDFLVAQMARAGPTFIKLAQWAGSRSDLFPPMLCEKLGKLHSNGKAHPFRHTKRVIERVFGKHFDEIFEEFDHTPIGVGAIAQVYRATLKQDLLPPSYLDPKRPVKTYTAAIARTALEDPAPTVPTASVAIKIKHPKVDKLIARDLAIMNFFACFIGLFPGMEWLSLQEEVQVFGSMMHGQLNLRTEADNLVKFEEHFAGRKEPVGFPRPLCEFSTHDILVEEFQHALPLEAFLRNGGGPFDDQLAELGLDAFLNMLLLDNFVHADLHPGNIMVKFCRPSTRLLLKNALASLFRRTNPSDPMEPYSTTESDEIVTRLRALESDAPAWRAELARLNTEGFIPEVVFIDAGLVTTLNESNRANFLELFRAIAEFDGYRAGTLMVERCRAPQLAVEPETFALKIQHLVLDVKRKTFSLGQIKISDVLTQVLKAVRDHHVKMEGDFVNTVLSILLLEGIGRQLDPQLDLFKSALPILRQLGRQMSKDDSLAQMPVRNLGAMLKVWVYLEARGLANAAFVNVDDMVRYDRLSPSI